MEFLHVLICLQEDSCVLKSCLLPSILIPFVQASASKYCGAGIFFNITQRRAYNDDACPGALVYTGYPSFYSEGQFDPKTNDRKWVSTIRSYVSKFSFLFSPFGMLSHFVEKPYEYNSFSIKVVINSFDYVFSVWFKWF